MTASLVLLHAYTPLHSGAGQGVESIDLPIARERATRLPVVPGYQHQGLFARHYTPDRRREGRSVWPRDEERGCTRRRIAGRGCAADSLQFAL